MEALCPLLGFVHNLLFSQCFTPGSKLSFISKLHQTLIVEYMSQSWLCLQEAYCSLAVILSSHQYQLAAPQALSSTAMQCCRGVSTKIASHFKYSGWILFSLLQSLNTKELADYLLSDFGLGNGWVHLRVPSLHFFNGRHVGGIEELLEVFLPSSDDVSCWGQQLLTHTVKCIGKACSTSHT